MNRVILYYLSHACLCGDLVVVVLFLMGSFVFVLCPGCIITLVLVPVLVVGRLIADSSVKAAIASFNLFLVSKNGFADSDGYFKASVNSSIAAVALSEEAVVDMVYFSGRNTTVSETLVPLVLGM
jgi:type IV secretory pathway VirB3-like protein